MDYLRHFWQRYYWLLIIDYWSRFHNSEQNVSHFRTSKLARTEEIAGGSQSSPIEVVSDDEISDFSESSSDGIVETSPSDDSPSDDLSSPVKKQASNDSKSKEPKVNPRTTIDEDEIKRIRQHKKRINPQRLSLPRNHWEDCIEESVNSLPHDINGKKVYTLPFDPKHRMSSSKDGRNWGAWVTSNTKSWAGIRRISKCKGGWKCVNPKCEFLQSIGKENTFYFVVRDDQQRCKYSTCVDLTDMCVSLECSCVKVWEFDEHTKVVRVSHDGMHQCTARRVTKTDEEKLRDIFKKNPKTTPIQASRNIIVDALDDPENMTSEELYRIVDGAMDAKRIRYVKQQQKNESRPFGHSFEAVGIFRNKMKNIDPFFVYKINNRMLNGEPSFVFKTGKRQLEILLGMDENLGNSLSQEYLFFDGTFKRWIYF